MLRLGHGFDGQADVEAGGVRQPEQSVQGQAVEPAVHDIRDSCLVDAESGGGCRLGESAVTNDLGNAPRELGLRQQLVRVVKPQIGKDIVTASCAANRMRCSRRPLSGVET
ncbi:MAG: hypothetical protein ACRDJ9_31260, partial [Dehalococcoidia bacterium]